MVSLPTWGTSLRLTASCATKRTVQRARPSGGLLHTMAIKRCFWLSSSTSAAPGRCFSYSARAKPAPDVADGLCRQRNYVGNTRRGGPLGELQKSQRAQNDTHLLNSGAQQLSKFFLIFGRHFNTQGWTGQALSMGQNISEWNCFLAKTSSGQRPSSRKSAIRSRACGDGRKQR
jgi:hypothetical protein